MRISFFVAIGTFAACCYMAKASDSVTDVPAVVDLFTLADAEAMHPQAPAPAAAAAASASSKGSPAAAKVAAKEEAKAVESI